MNEDVPQAIENRSRWVGWIWSVPIAALAIVGYLTFQQFAQNGPTVTVIFPTADLKPDDTSVKYDGMEVGKVESVRLQKDLKHVTTVLRLHPDMAGHLGKGTVFWIAGKNPSFSNLSALKSIIAGPYIGIEPHPGSALNSYQGLAQRPISADDPQGAHYVLTATKLGNIGRGSNVYYRDLQVGEVEATHLEADNRHFRIDFLVRGPFEKLVHTGSRFWDAGAVAVSMGGSGPRLQLQSVPALLDGALGFETPEGPTAGPAATPGTSFKLYDSRAAAEHAPNRNAVRYQVVFDGQGAGSLSDGAPVTLENKRIGSVTDSRLRYDPTTGQLGVIATLAIEPRAIDLSGKTKWADNAKPQMDALLRTLIGQGLRAQLSSTIPLVGSKGVKLAFVSGAGQASLGTGPVPDIPAGPASDISGTLAAVNAVAAKIDAMPLDQIASDIHNVTKHMASLSDSPQVANSLKALERSLDNIEQVTRVTKGQVGPLLTALRRSAAQAQSTLAATHNLVGNGALTQREPDTAGLGSTLYELGRAARSLRTLADYLDRHPEALLRGRGGSG